MGEVTKHRVSGLVSSEGVDLKFFLDDCENEFA
jgi:hypothetical protein